MPKIAAIQTSALFFFLGFFTCTWDLLLTRDMAGFTLKAHQLFFLLSFLSAIFARRHLGFRALLMSVGRAFPLSFLALAVYYALTSPWSAFPLKSFLYAGWLGFNLCTIWLSARWLAGEISKRCFALLVLLTMAFHSLVIAIDHMAYQYGYTGGWLGHNQDALLHWGASRPHAFSSEPSYIATFLCFSLLITWGALTLPKLGNRFFYWGAFFLGIFAIVAVTSRTGWLGLAAGLALFECLNFFSNRRKLAQRAVALSALALITVGLFFLTTPPSQRQILDKSLVSSIASGVDGSGNARLMAHKYAWEMAKETHFLGTGLGASYKYWTSTHDTRGVAPQGEFGPQAYGNEIIMSTWGQLLAEGGIPAILLYAAAAFFLIRALWRSWRGSGDPLTQAALASAVVFFCFTAFWLGNVARGDVWVWFAIWSRMALPDSPASTERESALA